jgi:hypothetical protein
VKTPREILLERHGSAEPKLDAIRQNLLAQKSAETAPLSARLIRELLLPLRWHLAGISAVWLMVALLSADPASTPVMAAAEPPSTPRQLIAVLTENRRQLVEMIEPNGTELAPAPQPFAPRRRSDAQPISVVV